MSCAKNQTDSALIFTEKLAQETQKFTIECLCATDFPIATRNGWLNGGLQLVNYTSTQCENNSQVTSITMSMSNNITQAMQSGECPAAVSMLSLSQ